MSRAATRSAVIVRARRYVSAPEGAYPDPVAPGQETDAPLAAAEPALDPAATVAVPFEIAQAAAGAYGDADMPIAHEAAASEWAAEPAAELSGPLSGSVHEDAYEPYDDQEARVAEAEYAADAAAVDSPAPVHDPFPEAARGTGSAPLARLVGGVAGALVGAAAGIALLALARGEDLVGAFKDPAALWAGTSDPVLLVSAALVAGGFALFGFALPKGRTRSSS